MLELLIYNLGIYDSAEEANKYGGAYHIRLEDLKDFELIKQGIDAVCEVLGISPENIAYSINYPMRSEYTCS